MGKIVRDETIPAGFDSPIALPETAKRATEWQEANRAWWQKHPMRYDWRDEVPYAEFTREFYEEVDKRFFSDVSHFMPWSKIPFDPLISFESLATKDVLEIGVGGGSHAQLLAGHAKTFTGIDITDHAVKSTSRRLDLVGLRGRVLRMDAERMEFPDNSFDFVWSWGVIHHSSNTANVLKEIHRVLRPRGTATTMVYHRNPWNYYVVSGLVLGVIRGKLLKTRSLHRIQQEATDGAIARYYTESEWRKLLAGWFVVDKVDVLGSKTHVVLLPAGRLKQIVMRALPDKATRFLTNYCRLGGFLVSTFHKH